VANKKRIIGKKWRAEEEESHTRGGPKTIGHECKVSTS
jgi:hypothetical protein